MKYGAFTYMAWYYVNQALFAPAHHGHGGHHGDGHGDAHGSGHGDAHGEAHGSGHGEAKH